MEQLKRPFWLLLTFICPLVLLILLFNETYQIIESLLTQEQKNLWSIFGTYYSILISVGTVYVGYLLIKKKMVDYITAWLVLLINILNITLFFFFIDQVLPNNIPEWMFTSSDLTIYPYSFLIPGALYSLIILVLKYTPKPKTTNAFINLVPIIGIPIFVILLSFGLNIFGSLDSSDVFWFKYVPIYLLVFLTCGFLFFLIRFIFIISTKSKKRDSLLQAFKIVFTCIFPVLGLFFNNTLDSSSGGIFGDFQDPWYFIFSIINGVVLCVPDLKNNKLRWLFFILRSILFVFILYFFVVFLPYLPLSILAILAVGFGFLMLAPIIVFVYQLSAIRNDIIYLKTVSSKALVYIVFWSSMLVLPMAITINYQMDRNELDRIFTFLYNRSFDDEEQYSFDTKRVDRLMNHIHDVKSDWLKHTPFLDSYYNWIVLDNLMLSDKKINEISSVINGDKLNSKTPLFSWFTFPAHSAYLDDYHVQSTYNGKHWTSYLHIEVATNDIEDSEFRLYLNTPNDCFVSNYYLEINGKKEFGILAEKKSANWVYNNIVKTRRDPGILNSVGYNKYILKVFPVQQNQKRLTGIEFIHNEPIEIAINDTIVTLGDPKQTNKNIREIMGGKGVFIPSAAKIKLPSIVRKPDYHLIIDKSINNKMNVSQLEKIINHLKDSLPNPENIHLWAVNYDNHPLSEKFWKNEINTIEQKGGFYPEFLMKKTLVQSYKNQIKTCPIFILVNSDSSSVSFVDGLSNLMFSIPDMARFYSCNEKMVTYQYNLETGQKIEIESVQKIKPDSLYVYKRKNTKFYLPFDNNSEFIYDSVSLIPQTKWQEGVVLGQMMKNYALNPQLNDEWINIVKGSMKSGILVPYTSYISLENEAQKKALLHKQKEVLETDKHFDLEEAEEMSEPNVMWYILV
jgi:hypothetical protein